MTPHQSLMEEKMYNIAVQEAMKQIRGLKVELITNTCGDVGFSVQAKLTFFGQELSTTSIFIQNPKKE